MVSSRERIHFSENEEYSMKNIDICLEYCIVAIAQITHLYSTITYLLGKNKNIIFLLFYH